MIRTAPRPAALRRLALTLALATAGLAAGPAEAQGAGDDYATLSADVGANGTVAVLVTGWRAVTGDEPETGASAAEGGLVAITGDEFVKSVTGGGRVSNVRRFEHLPAIAMTVDAAALATAKDYGDRVRVWRDWPVEPLLVDSGPLVGADWVHRNGYTGEGTFVAVIDTGTDVAHPFIAGREIVEACFADRCPNGRPRMVGPGAARPVHAHGTHVAGIALGRGRGVSGVAPKAGLIAINVFERSGGARNSNILAALDWLIGVARTGRATIASVNMSLGAARHFAEPCPDRIYDLAAKLLARQNVALVAAAGNESSRHGISHPACVRDIISVGAIDKRFRVAEFSNSAPILDMLAPGVAILSSVPLSGRGKAPFKEYPGTSMAAPHVAGAYALLRQAAPVRPLHDLSRALIRGGRQVRDERNGIVKPGLDVARALAELGIRISKNPPPKGEDDAGTGTPPGQDRTEPAPPRPEAPGKTDGWRSIGG